MRAFSVSWSDSQGEARIKYAKVFLESDWILQVDTLSDAISELKDLYNDKIKEVPEAIANALGHYLDE
jgi:hypothetical protein